MRWSPRGVTLLDRTGTSAPSCSRPWYRRAWFSWVVVIAIAVVIVAGPRAPGAAMDDRPLHVLQGHEAGREDAGRLRPRGIDCTECHIPPGAVAASKWRLTEAGTCGPTTSACRAPPRRTRPHQRQLPRVPAARHIPNETAGVRMNHAEHLKLRHLLCVDCHDAVSHKQPGQSEGVSMITCAMCHNEQGAPDGCGFCHAAPPASEHAPDFVKEHGKEALANRGGLPPLPSRQEGVLRQVPRLPAVVPLLGTVALHSRRGRRRGPREL